MNNNTIKWIWPIVLAIFGAGGFYFKSKDSVEAIPSLKERVQAHETKIAVIETDIKYIKDGVDRLIRMQERRR